MPRPRAAECPPVTRGRVRATDAEACGSKRALGAAVKNLQATSLSLDLVQRPRADGGVPGALGVLRDALSLGPLRLRYKKILGSPAGKPRWPRGGVAEGLEDHRPRAGGVFGCGCGASTRIVERGHGCRVDTPSCSRAPAVRARGRAGRA